MLDKFPQYPMHTEQRTRLSLLIAHRDHKDGRLSDSDWDHVSSVLQARIKEFRNASGGSKRVERRSARRV